MCLFATQNLWQTGSVASTFGKKKSYFIVIRDSNQYLISPKWRLGFAAAEKKKYVQLWSSKNGKNRRVSCCWIFHNLYSLKFERPENVDFHHHLNFSKRDFFFLSMVFRLPFFWGYVMVWVTAFLWSVLINVGEVTTFVLFLHSYWFQISFQQCRGISCTILFNLHFGWYRICVYLTLH